MKLRHLLAAILLLSVLPTFLLNVVVLTGILDTTQGPLPYDTPLESAARLATAPGNRIGAFCAFLLGCALLTSQADIAIDRLAARFSKSRERDG